MMARRLHMTSADYVAIAISPALIMALVGSLVFFLIEVLYIGEYQARLNYVFALFVFAAVLVARISIEMGSERAALFALPLGGATFLVLWRFVEHPSPVSPLINLLLIGVVWWCAHKLTWDCTLIDDDEDASGEGLLQRIGVDADSENEPSASSPGNTANELAEDDRPDVPWWQRVIAPRRGPHSPGMWVLYFSIAALPLFGIGQWWIPAADVGRRRYAFALLAVYVASGLALLVTTSFLGLRRYLRQRHVEMPAPMAATWVAMGGVLIILVMLLAALIPRPHAEYAISQVPWQARSPEGLRATRHAFGREAAQEQDQAGQLTSKETNAPSGTSADDQQHAESTLSDQGQRSGEQASDTGQSSSRPSDKQPQSEPPGNEQASESRSGKSSRSGEPTADGQQPDPERPSGEQAPSETPSEEPQAAQESSQAFAERGAERSADTEVSRNSSRLRTPDQPSPVRMLQQLPASIGGLAGALKLLFYVVAGLAILYLAWRNRRELVRALTDILHALGALWARLWGDRSADAASGDAEPANTATNRRRFRDFRDPFMSGQYQHLAPSELVCYTFEAFEAWAGDRGQPRTPDQTPQELLRMAVDPHSPLYPEARRLVRLYSELAYASGTVGREHADKLRDLWRLMRNDETFAASTR